MLEELHRGHLGVVKMKALAKRYIRWQGIDKEIGEAARLNRVPHLYYYGNGGPHPGSESILIFTDPSLAACF